MFSADATTGSQVGAQSVVMLIEITGKAHADGYTKEWGVQLSKKDETAWKKYAKKIVGGKYYVNVTPNGYLSH